MDPVPPSPVPPVSPPPMLAPVESVAALPLEGMVASDMPVDALGTEVDGAVDAGMDVAAVVVGVVVG